MIRSPVAIYYQRWESREEIKIGYIVPEGIIGLDPPYLETTHISFLSLMSTFLGEDKENSDYTYLTFEYEEYRIGFHEIAPYIKGRGVGRVRSAEMEVRGRYFINNIPIDLEVAQKHLPFTVEGIRIFDMRMNDLLYEFLIRVDAEPSCFVLFCCGERFKYKWIESYEFMESIKLDTNF